MYLIYEGSIYNYLTVIPLKNERGLAIFTLLIISKSIKKTGFSLTKIRSATINGNRRI